MSKSPETQLEEFLAPLPAYIRKVLEQGLSSLTQEERTKWFADAAVDNFESATALQEKYLHIIKRIPARAAV